MAASFSRDPLQWAEAHARHAWVEDGLTDMAVGMYLVLYGALFQLSQQDGWWAKLLFLAFVLISAWKGRELIQRLKTRWVYPRTGYMRPRRPPLEQRLAWSAGILLATLALIAALLVLDLPDWLSGCGVLTMLFTGLFAWLGWRHAARRYLFLAAGNGLGLAWLLFTQPAHCLVVYPLIANGVLLIGVGSLTFSRFLQRHPLPKDA
ncbi:MAG: DUF4395 family protein [Chloroflexi bacterium]|nr:DUF4395 family protein [Chloroflexota bacterium]